MLHLTFLNRSIFSASTIEPLQISRELLLKALTRYNVPADFLSIVISFGDDPHLSEGSSSNMSIVGSVDSDQCRYKCLGFEVDRLTNLAISYQINYVEENDRKGEDPWSRRHTGVFHHHGSKESIWILLFPTQEKYCKVESQLRQLEAGTSDAQAVLEAIITNPLRLHMFLFSSYFENWRWYLRKLGEDFAYIVRPPACGWCFKNFILTEDRTI